MNPSTAYRPALEVTAQSLGAHLLTIPISYGADLKPAIEQFAAGPDGALRMGGPKPAVALESIRLATHTACLRFR